MPDREAMLQARRLRQPLAELRRKADKARRRQQIWTAEEVDYAKAWAADIIAGVVWE